MNTEIYYTSAVELSTQIRKKEVSPVEVMCSYLDRIDSLNPKLNALVTLADDAMERVHESEEAIFRG